MRIQGSETAQPCPSCRGRSCSNTDGDTGAEQSSSAQHSIQCSPNRRLSGNHQAWNTKEKRANKPSRNVSRTEMAVGKPGWRYRHSSTRKSEAHETTTQLNCPRCYLPWYAINSIHIYLYTCISLTYYIYIHLHYILFISITLTHISLAVVCVCVCT
jgi:hypothetical protein